MRAAPTPAQVDAAYDSLVGLRVELGTDAVVERDLATLLAEFLLTACQQCGTAACLGCGPAPRQKQGAGPAGIHGTPGHAVAVPALAFA
jgi:hypothetical protein